MSVFFRKKKMKNITHKKNRREKEEEYTEWKGGNKEKKRLSIMNECGETVKKNKKRRTTERKGPRE